MPFLPPEHLKTVNAHGDAYGARLKYCPKCECLQPSLPPAAARMILAFERIRPGTFYSGRICRICGWSIESGHQIEPDVRKAVLVADSGQCVYCGSHKWICVDHVIARNNGGSDNFGNLVTACRSCNVKKGPRDPMPMRFGRFR
jgi:5-methylcytosine-specific restriction endonuclease McrA